MFHVRPKNGTDGPAPCPNDTCNAIAITPLGRRPSSSKDANVVVNASETVGETGIGSAAVAAPLVRPSQRLWQRLSFSSRAEPLQHGIKPPAHASQSQAQPSRQHCQYETPQREQPQQNEAVARISYPSQSAVSPQASQIDPVSSNVISRGTRGSSKEEGYSGSNTKVRESAKESRSHGVKHQVTSQESMALAKRSPETPRGAAIAELCSFCFSVLLSHLKGKPAPAFPSSADPFYKAPLFVTWLKRRRNDGDGGRHTGDPELRGCIGCLEPVSFRPGLSDYVLRSSMQDRRFPPIVLEEVPALICRLSILSQFESCAHVYDWIIGTHGILIHFSDAHRRNYSATYLPEIALEQGMTQATAIRELVVKAGYTGPCDQDLLSRIQCTRYQSVIEDLNYKDFIRCNSGEDLIKS